MKHILQCEKCKTFSMKEICPSCGSKCESVRPAKFSLQDTYGRERRIAKKEIKEN
ncbi:MAG: nucleolar RNA-binding Nop10p family protein [Candidatus Woesearchaeota archaeon]|jgi:H/ACA ribonucleoprotein complex subunit 3